MADILVTTRDDITDANDGVLSLREAISLSTNSDVIKFSATLAERHRRGTIYDN